MKRLNHPTESLGERYARVFNMCWPLEEAWFAVRGVLLIRQENITRV